MAKLTPAPSLTSTRSIYKDLINATSSPGLAGGLTLSDSPDGRIADLFGLEVALASRSRSRAKAPVQTIQGTCGPTFIASSALADPLSSWENRLRERLGTGGSMEFELIWKELVTPGGRSIFRLSRSTPRTFANGSIGSLKTWNTPTCHMAKEAGYPAEFTRNTISLTAEAHIATWPTPRSSSAMAEDAETILARGGEYKSRLEQVTATWPTPTKADGDGGHEMGTASVTGRREDGSKITVSLPGVVKIVSTWPTPRAVDGDKGSRTPEGCEKEIARKGRLDDLPSTIVHLSGTTTSGSPDQTENRGALNPAFPCWLMGYPTEWDACAPTATPSSRRSRQK